MANLRWRLCGLQNMTGEQEAGSLCRRTATQLQPVRQHELPHSVSGLQESDNEGSLQSRNRDVRVCGPHAPLIPGQGTGHLFGVQRSWTTMRVSTGPAGHEGGNQSRCPCHEHGWGLDEGCVVREEGQQALPGNVYTPKH